jgi:hypothetical protein
VIEDPHAGCREVRFAAPLTLEPAGEVALEDYARVLLGGRHAEVVRGAPLPAGYDAGPISGVHVCDPASGSAALDTDVEHFARELAVDTGATGLGWN